MFYVLHRISDEVVGSVSVWEKIQSELLRDTPGTSLCMAFIQQRVHMKFSFLGIHTPGLAKVYHLR
jgi:hypothetical protein